jgi:hypothetical protein
LYNLQTLNRRALLESYLMLVAERGALFPRKIEIEHADLVDSLHEQLCVNFFDNPTMRTVMTPLVALIDAAPDQQKATIAVNAAAIIYGEMGLLDSTADSVKDYCAKLAEALQKESDDATNVQPDDA